MSEEELRLGMWKVSKTCSSFSNCVKRSFNSLTLGIKPAMLQCRVIFIKWSFTETKVLEYNAEICCYFYNKM